MLVNISLIFVILLLLYIIFTAQIQEKFASTAESFTSNNKLNITYIDQNNNTFYLTTKHVYECDNIGSVIHNPKNQCLPPKDECGIALPVLAPQNTNKPESQIFYAQRMSATGLTFNLINKMDGQQLYISEILLQTTTPQRTQLCLVDRFQPKSTVCSLIPNGTKYNIQFGNTYVALCDVGTDARCTLNWVCEQKLNGSEHKSEHKAEHKAEYMSEHKGEHMSEETNYIVQYKRLCLTTDITKALLFNITTVN